MRTLLLAVSLLAFATGSVGCRMTSGSPVAAGLAERGARPFDNFGEILSVRKAAPTTKVPGGASPLDNFGEIL